MDEPTAAHTEEIDWFESVTGGALGSWSLSDSREAFSKVAEALFDRLERGEVELREFECQTDDGSDHNDACRAFMLDQAACSQAVVGLLAPLAETLIYRSTQALRNLSPSLKPPQSGTPSRGDLSDDEFWNPSVRYDKNRVHDDLLGGFRQLLKAINRLHIMPTTSWKNLDAIFRYRNRALHRGFTWDQAQLESFDHAITKCEWNEWFEIITLRIGDEKPQPYIIVVTRTLMEDFLSEIEKMASSLWSGSRPTKGSSNICSVNC